MSYVNEMMEFNRKFIAEKQYESYRTSKMPDKKLVILSCMDTRLEELLPAALNLKNGDAKMIKNAGAVITSPFGSVMRSLLLAVYDLGAEEIMVIGHYDCGVHELEPSHLLNKMLARNIRQEDIDTMNYYGVDVHSWLTGFPDPADSVRETIDLIRRHPLLPKDVAIHGFLIDPETGRLDAV